MNKIITITANPAFDLHYALDTFTPGKENYVTSMICHAGGKGVNISRALIKNGYESTAFVISGNENGDAYEQSLKSDGIRFTSIRTDGRIRENITLHPAGAAETRISFDSFSVTGRAFDRLVSSVMPLIGKDTYVAFCGRLPKGIPVALITGFLTGMKNAGAKLTVDSNSMPPEAIKKVKPWLIKPNEQEIAGYTGKEVKTADEAVSAARGLTKGGVAEQVMISLGDRGAVFDDGSRSYIITVPAIGRPVSTIGAGDSTIAGYLAGTVNGMSKTDALRIACAFGTASCLNEGTLPPQPAQIKDIFEKTTVREI